MIDTPFKGHRRRSATASAVTLVTASALLVLFQWILTPPGSCVIEAADGDLVIEPFSIVIDEPCDEDIELSAQLAGAGSDAKTQSGRFDARTDLAAAAGSDGFTTLHIPQNLMVTWSQLSQLTITNLPLTASEQVGLTLTRTSVFDSRTQFVVHDGDGSHSDPAPSVDLFRGSVTGHPESWVAVGISKFGINGYIHHDGHSYSISSGPSDDIAAQGILSCTVSRLSATPLGAENPLTCGTESAGLINIEGLRAGITEADLAPAARICHMAVVCDYDFYQRMGASVEATNAYVAQLMASSSLIFERELGITLWLSYLEVWTTQDDPFSECGLNGLDEFRDYGNANLLDGDWNLAYRISGCGGGGRAYLDGLCVSGHALRGRNPYATGAMLGFYPTPVAPNDDNYDLYLMTHEIGHNFGADHTHCYDPPLDRCTNTENSCFSGDTVCTRGTIMSYCNRCGGLDNVDLRFHPGIKEIVLARLANSCLGTTLPGLFARNRGDLVLQVDSVVSTEDWLSASRDAFLINPHDSAIIFPRVDWSQVTASGQIGQLLVYSSDDPMAMPFVVDVTAKRNRPFSNFSFSQSEGCWPLTVTFTDLSSNSPESWTWDFDNGDSSTEQSPTYTFDRAGTFNVALTSLNDCGPHRSQFEAIVSVTEPALCCTSSTFVISKNGSLLQAIDLWECGPDAPGPSEGVRYHIAPDTVPLAGASIGANRYLSFFPATNWFGAAELRIQSITSDNCRCETPVTLIVNDPPSITLLDPPSGVTTVNRPYPIRWIDSDGDNNAEIQLYYTGANDCTGGIPINSDPILEDLGRSSGEYVWQVFGLPDGYYRLRAVITDEFAQYEACSPGLVLLDQTPPTTQSIVECLSVNENGWCHGDVRVTLVSEDTLTGTEGTFYSLNSGPWQAYTQPLVIEFGGATLVEYFSVDSAGNVEAVRTTDAPIQIDRSAPRIEQINSGNELFREGDFTTELPTFSILITDGGVGIDLTGMEIEIAPGSADGPLRYTFDDDNVSFNTGTRRVAVEATSPLTSGAQRLTMSITDLLGNVAMSSTDFVVGSGMVIQDVINSPNPFQQETYFTFTLTDEPTDVLIRVYDLSGLLMREINVSDAHAGYNEVRWNGQTDDNITLANGAYLYEISASGPRGSARTLEKLAILR